MSTVRDALSDVGFLLQASAGAGTTIGAGTTKQTNGVRDEVSAQHKGVDGGSHRQGSHQDMHGVPDRAHHDCGGENVGQNGDWRDNLDAAGKGMSEFMKPPVP